MRKKRRIPRAIAAEGSPGALGLVERGRVKDALGGGHAAAVRSRRPGRARRDQRRRAAVPRLRAAVPARRPARRRDRGPAQDRRVRRAGPAVGARGRPAGANGRPARSAPTSAICSRASATRSACRSCTPSTTATRWRTRAPPTSAAAAARCRARSRATSRWRATWRTACSRPRTGCRPPAARRPRPPPRRRRRPPPPPPGPRRALQRPRPADVPLAAICRTLSCNAADAPGRVSCAVVAVAEAATPPATAGAASAAAAAGSPGRSAAGHQRFRNGGPARPAPTERRAPRDRPARPDAAARPVGRPMGWSTTGRGNRRQRGSPDVHRRRAHRRQQHFGITGGAYTFGRRRRLDDHAELHPTTASGASRAPDRSASRHRDEGAARTRRRTFDYATYWGAAVALDLNNPTNSANAQLPYDASEHGVKGFQFSFQNRASQRRPPDVSGPRSHHARWSTTASTWARRRASSTSDAKQQCYWRYRPALTAACRPSTLHGRSRPPAGAVPSTTASATSRHSQ